VYSDLERLTGRKLDASSELKNSLAGRSSSMTVQPADQPSVRLEDETLAVYVPMSFAGSKTPAGGLALYQPFEPIAAGIAEDTRTLYLILLAGLVILWAAIARIASGASKQLRRQATDNQRQAQHDALTGLPNRALFRDLVQNAMSARRKGSVVAVMVMDLDRFKEINDTLGHYNGDLLLQRVGPRIRRALRDADTVARLGGDEYAVLLPEIPDKASPSFPTTATGWTPSSSGPTLPCTPRRRRTRASRSTRPSNTSTPPTAWPLLASCGAPSTRRSSCSTTSRRPASRPGASSAWRDSCAGSTRAEAC
jgi:GGDEF domain-containing protein